MSLDKNTREENETSKMWAMELKEGRQCKGKIVDVDNYLVRRKG